MKNKILPSGGNHAAVLMLLLKIFKLLKVYNWEIESVGEVKNLIFLL